MRKNKQDLQKVIEDFENQLCFIEQLYQDKEYLLDDYNYTKEWDVLWEIYDSMKINLQNKFGVIL